MKILSIELRRLELTLVHPVATSTGVHDQRPILLVTVRSDVGDGVGECSALLEPTYSPEFADGAEAVLLAELLPRLFAEGEKGGSVEHSIASMSLVDGNQMAKAAIEMALLDAQLRGEGRSLGSFLGAKVDRVAAGATVGIDTPKRVVTQVDFAVAAGYRRIKLKIAPGHDLEIVRAVRDAFPDLGLSVDANGAYDIDNHEQHEVFAALAACNLIYFEQPLAMRDLAGHRRLRELISTPIVLDESICSVGDLEVAAEYGALDGVSIKTARLGGIATAVALHDRCVALGLHLCLGGMFESGVGRAAALAVGALPGFDLPGDLGGSDRYFSHDITAPHVVSDGYLPVPQGPGLGIELQPQVVRELTTRVYEF